MLDFSSTGVIQPCSSFLLIQVVFYCHFPDLLLAQHTTVLRRIYRKPIDFVEETTTGVIPNPGVMFFTWNVFCSFFTFLCYVVNCKLWNYFREMQEWQIWSLWTASLLHQLLRIHSSVLTHEEFVQQFSIQQSMWINLINPMLLSNEHACISLRIF